MQKKQKIKAAEKRQACPVSPRENERCATMVLFIKVSAYDECIFPFASLENASLSAFFPDAGFSFDWNFVVDSILYPDDLNLAGVTGPF